jgi:DNA repair protein RadC
MSTAAHPHDERPREKLQRAGAASLVDSELLALVLGHGTPGATALQIAQSVLREVGGVRELTRVSTRRLARVPGVGPAQASRVMAAIELGRRTFYVPPAPRLPLIGSPDIARFLLPRFGAHPVERFRGRARPGHRDSPGGLSRSRHRGRRSHHRVSQPSLRRREPKPRRL